MSFHYWLVSICSPLLVKEWIYYERPSRKGSIILKRIFKNEFVHRPKRNRKAKVMI